jgi:hypothetical protein
MAFLQLFQSFLGAVFVGWFLDSGSFAYVFQRMGERLVGCRNDASEHIWFS